MSFAFQGEKLSVLRGDQEVFSFLDFCLKAGELLHLRGANGSGKSTLLAVMAGLLRPHAGVCLWEGDSIAQDPVAHGRRLSFIGHKRALKEELSLWQNSIFWARTLGLGEEEAENSLHRLGLLPLKDVRLAWLSEGQKRRAALSRLFLRPVPLWLLDEPFTSLDQATSGFLREAIAQQVASGGGVVLAGHGQEELPGARLLDLDRHKDQQGKLSAASPQELPTSWQL